MADTSVVHPQELLVGPVGRNASGWWGMACGIATEAAVFIYLLFTYYYLAIQLHAHWPPNGAPSLKLALPNTLVLVASSGTFAWAEQRAKSGDATRALFGFLATLALGTTFVGVQLLEWHNKAFTISSHPYGSIYFTLTGFHMAHVIVGLLVVATLALWTWQRAFDVRRTAPIAIGGLYWHFVDVVWIAVFLTLYVTPYLT